MVPEKVAVPHAAIPTRLPLLPVRDVVVFPHMVLPLDVSRPKSVKALEEAMAHHHFVFVSAQKQVETEDAQLDDIFPTGTVAKILELLKMPNGQLKILVEGQARGRIKEFKVAPERGFAEVEIERFPETTEITPEVH